MSYGLNKCIVTARGGGQLYSTSTREYVFCVPVYVPSVLYWHGIFFSLHTLEQNTWWYMKQFSTHTLVRKQQQQKKGGGILNLIKQTMLRGPLQRSRRGEQAWRTLVNWRNARYQNRRHQPRHAQLFERSPEPVSLGNHRVLNDPRWARLNWNTPESLRTKCDRIQGSIYFRTCQTKHRHGRSNWIFRQ